MDDIKFKLQLEQLQSQIDAHRMVIAWLIDQLQQNVNFHPDEISRFLSAQANELDGNRKFVEVVAEFDALRKDVAELELHRAAPQE